jgi:hypothetical protein
MRISKNQRQWEVFLLVLQEIVQKKKGEEREMADQSWQS